MRENPETIITKDKGTFIQEEPLDEERLRRFFDAMVADTEGGDEFESFVLDLVYAGSLKDVKSRKKIPATSIFGIFEREVTNVITKDSTMYTKLLASIERRRIYKEVSSTRGTNYHETPYGDFDLHVRRMVEAGKYSEVLLTAYTDEELRAIGEIGDPENDKKFTVGGLKTFANMFLNKIDKKIVELPQERYLSVIAFLLQEEDPEKRFEYIKDAYWGVSNQLLGFPTPTLKNAGTPHGTLSSCHIITVGDSIESIFDTAKQAGRFSSAGAGLGVYLGKLRGRGSWIRNVPEASTGIVQPSRLQSLVAEYVHQGGVRPGGIAIYLPTWHLDSLEFLELGLKTGDTSQRAHGVNLGITINDEYMRRINNKEQWTLFDPYEIREKLGFDLNDLFDMKKLKDGEEPNKIDHAFTYHYRLAENSNELTLVKRIKAIDLFRAEFVARKEGGTPYRFYTDTVNRANPNSHKGMVYCSNLCTEIAQNNHEDIMQEEYIDSDGNVVHIVKGEGLVTCTLSSLAINRVHYLDDENFQRLVDIQNRLLDNVIDLGYLAVHQAKATNDLYRSVGMGVMGTHSLLARESIRWDSDEATEFIGAYSKRILKAQLRSSAKLAKERGSYPLFEGSDWNTGAFFDKRGFVGEEWEEIRDLVKQGMRNGYISSPAPTATNSIISNCSAGTDPIYGILTLETKSTGNYLLVEESYEPGKEDYLQMGFQMDEMWSVRHTAEAQKYVDQAISHNYHIPRELFQASRILRLDNEMWELGGKTVYYTRSDDVEMPEDCVWCGG